MSAPILIDVEQRSTEWRMARLGRVGGSDAADMLATIKSGEAAARRDLRMRLVCERLTQQIEEQDFVSAEMQRGIDLEPAAFAAYEALTGEVVQRSGYLQHPTLMAGCSLDGHIDGMGGILELKCPKTATHLGYLRSGGIPPRYLPQLQHNLLISGAEWVDFLSFDDRLPPALQTFCVRLSAANAGLGGYEEKLIAFLGEVDAEEAALKAVCEERA